MKLIEQLQQALKRDDILKYFGNPEEPTLNSDRAILRALLRIYLNQTQEERSNEETIEHNKIGFSGTDGKILSSFCKQLINKGYLSEKQMIIIRKKVRKYANQIAKNINVGKIDRNNYSNDNKFIDKIILNWYRKSKLKYKN